MRAEFGDHPHRYAGAGSGKNRAGASPVTRQPGREKTVLARHIRNGRFTGVLTRQACTMLLAA